MVKELKKLHAYSQSGPLPDIRAIVQLRRQEFARRVRPRVRWSAV